MGYTDKGQVENYLLIDIDNSFDTQIASWIASVDSYIDKYVGRSFGVVTEDRYFDVDCRRDDLLIDEFQSINTVQTLQRDGVSVDLTLVENTDYLTYPYNSLPKWQIKLLRGKQISFFPEGSKRVKINAVWGSGATVPDDVQLAATILLSGIIEKGLKGGQISSESLGDYTVSFSSMETLSDIMNVKSILDHYKSFTL